MKNILFIGGPKTVQGVDRIDDDLVSILAADGLYDRKAVVVWPTKGFLSLPRDPAMLADACNMKLVELTAIMEKGLILPRGWVEKDYHGLVDKVREDAEAMASALEISARSQAFALLSKLVLAVSGGQNLVAVISKSTPPSAMRWAAFPDGWSEGQGREVKNYASNDPGYGALNAVGNWSLIYHGIKPVSVKAGDLVPRDSFNVDGNKIYYDANSYSGVENSLTAPMDISFPVTDRFGSARAVKVAGGNGYMLVVPEPDKVRNFIIGLKTSPAVKPKGNVASPKPIKPDTDQYMTRKDVAELLNMTTRTVDRRIADGKLKTTKIEGKVLILKLSVDALLG